MIKVLFITGFKRPVIMGRQLEGLYNCTGLENWIVCYHQDGLVEGGYDKETADVANYWLDKIATKTTVFRYIYNENKFIAIRQINAYINALDTHNADVVACFEDDLIPGKSYLQVLTELTDYSINDPAVAFVGGNYRNANKNCTIVNDYLMAYQVNWGTAHCRHKLNKIRNDWFGAFNEIFVKSDGVTPEPFKPDFERYNRVFKKYGLEPSDCWCQDILLNRVYEKHGFIRCLYPNQRHGLPLCSDGITSNRNVFTNILKLDEVTPDWNNPPIYVTKENVLYNLDGKIELAKIIDDRLSDKNSTHDYLTVYQPLLIQKYKTAKHVCEVGIASGGSVEMWSKFFINAMIYGIDVHPLNSMIPSVKSNKRITLYTEQDGYDTAFFKREFIDKGIVFDVAIDDGPHTLESMKTFLNLYSQILAPDGILIIEDVQKIEWIDELKNCTPNHLKPYIKVFDLRPNKGRYDDILFVIDLSV